MGKGKREERGEREIEKKWTTNHHYHMNPWLVWPKKIVFQYEEIKFITLWLKKLDFQRLHSKYGKPFVPWHVCTLYSDQNQVSLRFDSIEVNLISNLNFWALDPIGSKWFDYEMHALRRYAGKHEELKCNVNSPDSRLGFTNFWVKFARFNILLCGVASFRSINFASWENCFSQEMGFGNATYRCEQASVSKVKRELHHSDPVFSVVGLTFIWVKSMVLLLFSNIFFWNMLNRKATVYTCMIMPNFWT